MSKPEVKIEKDTIRVTCTLEFLLNEQEESFLDFLQAVREVLDRAREIGEVKDVDWFFGDKFVWEKTIRIPLPIE